MNRLYDCLANERIDSYEFPEVEDSEYKRVIGLIIQLRSRLFKPEDLETADLETIIEILDKI